MKAKHFKKIRSNSNWYDVDITTSLFGSFNPTWSQSVRVLARSHNEACHRAKRRGCWLNETIKDQTIEKWARWRVKLTKKSGNFKNVFYF